jgi:hypothetical protein
MDPIRAFLSAKSKRLLIPIACLFLLAAIADNAGVDSVAALLYLLAILMSVVAWKTRAKQKGAGREAKQAGNEEAYPVMQEVREIESGRLPDIAGDPIPGRAAGEAAHFHCQAIRYLNRSRPVGRRAGGDAEGATAVKAVELRLDKKRGGSPDGYGAGAFLGDFILTNKRVMFIHGQHGFECDIPSLGAIREAAHGRALLQCEGEFCALYLILTRDEETGRTVVIDRAAPLLSEAVSLIREGLSGSRV